MNLITEQDYLLGKYIDDDTFVITSRSVKSLNDELNFNGCNLDDLSFVGIDEYSRYLVYDTAKINFDVIQLIPGLKMRFEKDCLRIENNFIFINLKIYELLEYNDYKTFEKDVFMLLDEEKERECI